MSRERLLDLHQRRLGDNLTNNDKQDELLDALDGIDNVLTLILSSNDIELDNQQLTRIYDVIVRPKSSPTGLNIISAPQDNDEDDKSRKIVYKFDKTDTFIHSIFGDEKANDLFELVHSKYAFWAANVSALIAVLMRMFLKSVPFKLYYILVCIQWTTGVIGLIFIILSVNKTACKMVLKTFEFWLKLWFAVVSAITYFIYFRRLYFGYKNGYKYSDTYFFYIEICFHLIIIELCIFFSLVDAIQFKFWVRLTGCTVVSVYFTILFIDYNVYNIVTDYDYSKSIIHIDMLNLSVSLISIMGSAYQILCIFFWKQTIMSFRKRDRCVLLKYAPYIEWYDQTELNLANSNNTNIN